jgi:copper chaperone CopZ
MATVNLKVKGMHCKSCRMLVEDALNDLGAKNISVSVDEKKQIGNVSCTHADISAVKEAIRKEGYEVT